MARCLGSWRCRRVSTFLWRCSAALPCSQRWCLEPDLSEISRHRCRLQLRHSQVHSLIPPWRVVLGLGRLQTVLSLILIAERHLGPIELQWSASAVRWVVHRFHFFHAASGEVWALLTAGSAGFGNYRHQADVAHVSGC